MTLHARSELLAAPRKKLLYRFLAASVRHATPASLFLYAAAVLGLLALPLVVKDNYLDENALLAGSAVPRIRNSGALQSAADVQQRLKHAGNSANSGALQGTANDTSTTLLLELNGALEAAGFESYRQHFHTSTATGSSQHAQPWNCTNVHAIVRAPRGDGKECMLLVTPLHTSPGSQAQAGQLFGAAAAHAVMQYLASVPWLAKDVVWVLPDAGCGQMHSLQVWLEEAANGKWQRHASPFGRAGLMQQALVLDVASPSFNALEVHTIGFSGQLPMLDLYYLVAFLAEEHVGLPPAMKDLFGRPLAGRQTGYATKLGTMLRFVAQQALTRPSGVHAAFKEYGVDAVTLRTVLLPEKEALPAAEGLARLATLLELALRSCNNLLERLHHSVLLYLQVSPHAFVSVQAYIGPLVALLLILPLQAAASKRRAEGLLSAHALTGEDLLRSLGRLQGAGDERAAEHAAPAEAPRQRGQHVSMGSAPSWADVFVRVTLAHLLAITVVHLAGSMHLGSVLSGSVPSGEQATASLLLSTLWRSCLSSLGLIQEGTWLVGAAAAMVCTWGVMCVYGRVIRWACMRRMQRTFESVEHVAHRTSVDTLTPSPKKTGRVIHAQPCENIAKRSVGGASQEITQKDNVMYVEASKPITQRCSIERYQTMCVLLSLLAVEAAVIACLDWALAFLLALFLIPAACLL